MPRSSFGVRLLGGERQHRRSVGGLGWCSRAAVLFTDRGHPASDIPSNAPHSLQCTLLALHCHQAALHKHCQSALPCWFFGMVLPKPIGNTVVLCHRLLANLLGCVLVVPSSCSNQQTSMQALKRTIHPHNSVWTWALWGQGVEWGVIGKGLSGRGACVGFARVECFRDLSLSWTCFFYSCNCLFCLYTSH